MSVSVSAKSCLALALNALLVLCNLAPAAESSVQRAPDEKALEVAIEAIRVQEQAVKSLDIVAVGKWSKWNTASKAWEPNSEWDLSATYEGFPGGKVRVECSKNLTEWRNGPAPFRLRVFNMVYDGRMTTTLDTRAGDFSKPIELKEATIVGKRPQNLYLISRATGWYYSIYGNREGDATASEPKASYRFSEFLTQSQKDKGFGWERAERDGKQFLKVTLKEDLENQGCESVYWLDVANGYSIFRYERTDNGKKETDNGKKDDAVLKLGWEVTSFHKLGEGTFYPEHVNVDFGVIRGEAVQPINRVKVDISKAIARRSPADADTFKLQLPVGTMILDHIGDQRVTVRGTPKQQGQIISDQVRKAEALIKGDSATTLPHD